MTYQPKIGDRVRASLVYEGVVRGLPAHLHEGVHVRVELDAPTAADPMDLQRYLDERVWTFEKLTDPEPEWVNGDVVEVYFQAATPEARRYARVGGQWLPVNGGKAAGPYFIGNHWPENLKVILKAT